MSHGEDLRLSRRAARALVVAVVALGALTLAGMVALWPRDEMPSANRVGIAGPTYDGRVEEVVREPCTDAPSDERLSEPVCLRATIQLLEGPDESGTTSLYLPDSPTTPVLLVGDKIVLAYQADAEPAFRYAFVDRQRKPPLVWLALLFGMAVVVLGRLRGLAALGGLALSVVVLLTFVLPAIMLGRNAVLVAAVGASAIAFVALYLAHGFGPMTSVSLLGALASLGLTVILANAFLAMAKVSGFATEESLIIRLFATNVDASGLVLAGVVIGALGALDDVTVTQASAVWELKSANPALSIRELYHAGLRIGRDHVASTVNTLLLAYAGASLPLLLFFVLSQQSLGEVANQEVVATEIIRTLVGSIGLVASVPITTWLAAVVAGGHHRRQ